jgi:hypothetical protein
VHSNDNYLAAQYHRLVPHRGKKKAIVAVAHSMVEIAHVLLTRKVNYRDLGPDYVLQLNRKAVERSCVRQLQQLGYQVTLPKNRRLPRRTTTTNGIFVGVLYKRELFLIAWGSTCHNVSVGCRAW